MILNKKIIAHSTFVILLFLNIRFSTAAQSEHVKALKTKLETAKQDSDKIKVLSDLSWELQTTQIDVAEKYCQQEMKLAEKVNLEKFSATAFNDWALIKFRKGQLTEALDWNNKALIIRRKLKDEMGIASSLNKVASINSRLGNYKASLEASLECLKVYEKLNIKPYISYTENNIGTAFFHIHNTPKALEYYKRALKTNQELGDKINEGGNLGNIGDAYISIEQYDSALIYLFQCLKIYDETKTKFGKTAVLNSIGFVYKDLGKFEKAYPYYKQSMELAEEIKDTSALINCYNINANILMHLKRTDEAKPLIDKAFMMARQTNQTINLQQSFSQYFYYYPLKCEPEKAKGYFDLYGGIKDSMLNATVTKQMADMSVKYESEKKEQENLLLKKDNKIKSLTVWLLIIGLLLSGGIFILIFNRIKMKQREILQKEKLQQQEIRSKAVLEAEENERQRIAKDLHDGLGQTLSSVKLNLSTIQKNISNLSEQQQNMLGNAITMVDDSVKEVRTISHNMMPNMLIKKGLVNAVRDFIDKLNGTNLKIDLEITGMNERLETSVESIIFRVLQELVNNIIKHANANHITIQLLRFDNELTMMVEDNGNGFNVESTINSEKGIGLKNIVSRVEFLKGEIHFDSTISKGTTVSIEIPLT